MSSCDPASAAQTTAGGVKSTKSPAIYRDGKYLVVPQRWVELPAGCAVCGAAEVGRSKLTVRKATKLFALFGLFGMVVYYSTPVARLRAGLCQSHRSRERTSRIPVQVLVGLCVLCIAAGLYYFTLLAVMLGMTGVLVLLQLALMFEILRPKLFTAAHADRRFVWLAGVAPSIVSQAQEISPVEE